MSLDRRTFLQLMGGSAVSAGLPGSIAKALALPANRATGTIADVEHIVFMMQENRSFDHYFGTLRGVRGFGDPRAVMLESGHSVFHQPDGLGGCVLPFHPGTPDLGLRFLADLEHDWKSTHVAWNQGRHDQWVPAKTHLTMAHLQRGDIPFHYALADAFTICDAYHASLLGPTDPNRLHMFTGWVGNDGAGGGPVVDNSEAGYRWKTFPEILQAAGISWKVYQDIGTGLNAAGGWGNTDDPYIGNYGDNSLLFFDQYRTAPPGSPLYERAVTGTHAAAGGTLFDQFRSDCRNHALPQVSWVVAPEAYSEHPNWPANYGAYYVSQILDALTANPSVWAKTVFLIMYDENDGFFDHVVPPTPPRDSSQGLSNVSIANEIFPGTAAYPGGPYGLGARVPMLVVSPWSKGGWVNSEIFDHTSLIRFVAKRFGTPAAPLTNPNITTWRSAVCGDLTSAFDFAAPNGDFVALPHTGSYAPTDDRRHDSYHPPPAVQPALPVQEPGIRPARAVPYLLNVTAAVDGPAGELTLTITNAGSRAGFLHVRCAKGQPPPRGYTVAGHSRMSDVWDLTPLGMTPYALSVYGPNGLFRCYEGGLIPGISAQIQGVLDYHLIDGGVSLRALNSGERPCTLQILDRYAAAGKTVLLEPGARTEEFFHLGRFHGWYDLLLTTSEDPDFRQQFAGHLESGKDSMSDPAIAAR